MTIEAMTVEQSNEFFERGFATRRAMAILRGFNAEKTLALSRLAWDAGLAMVEVPLQSDESERALKATADAAAERGFVVGAGTITSIELVDRAAAAGARFTVAPGYDPAVAEHSIRNGMPHLPGVGTGTEVQAAMKLGLTWLKAFPANVLGAGWISAMHGPFPSARFVTTGGVDATNAQAFLTAGAAAVALGSSFAKLSEAELAAIG